MRGGALTSVILIRNTMSFAIGYGITPWLTNMGQCVDIVIQEHKTASYLQRSPSSQLAWYFFRW
jgi:hypothetical protein